MTLERITTIPVKKCGYQRGLVRHLYFILDALAMSKFTADRILYRGSQLDMAVYSRAELRGSDHKPGG